MEPARRPLYSEPIDCAASSMTAIPRSRAMSQIGSRSAQPPTAQPSDWLDAKEWARLAFMFDRYEPESVSHRTAEWSL